MVPQGTGSVTYKAVGLFRVYNDNSHQFLWLLNGKYQESTEPFKTGYKNEFNYKIVKRIR